MNKIPVKRMHILLSLLALSVCAFLFRDRLIRPIGTLARFPKGRYSVGQRLAQYGAAVRERLAEDFKRADCPYPPAKILLVGLKKEKRLEVWVKADENSGYALLRAYPIQGMSGGLGPKLCEGDGQVPEGIYRIDWLNPNSLYHLSMHVDYPNEYDRARSAEDGRDALGGEIMIHGGHASAGCLAMGDEAAEDLFVLVAETGLENVGVILSPVDFRKRDFPENAAKRLPDWAGDLYRTIRQHLDATLAEMSGSRVLPDTDTNRFGRYLEPGETYKIAPGKRDELVSLAVSGSGRDMRAANALLAFEALGKAQEDNRHEFPDAKRHAKSAMSAGTNDWITILAEVVLFSANNLQRENVNRHSDITNAVALFQKITPAVWEVPDNPLYRLWTGGEQVTAEKLRQMLSACIVGDYCALYRFDDADAFLEDLPDSREKRELKGSVDAQKKARAFFLESIRKNGEKQEERKQ